MEKYLWILAAVLLTALATWFLLRFLPGKSKAEEVWPRLFGAVLLSEIILAGIYFISPQQAEVVYYKFALVIAATFLAVKLDQWIFPYARPDGYLKKFWQDGTKEPLDQADHEIVDGYHLAFGLATIRRTLIVIAVVVSTLLGL